MAVYRLKTETPLRQEQNPHIHSPLSVSKITWSKIAALIPLWLAGIACFGGTAFIMSVLVYGSAMFFEWLYQKTAGGGKVRSSEILLVSLVLTLWSSPNMPWWAVVFETFIAVVAARGLFGGAGEYLFHPVLIAAAAVSAFFWPMLDLWGLGLKPHAFTAFHPAFPVPIFFLHRSALLSGASAFLALVGGVALGFKKVISWEIPLVFLAAAGLGAVTAGGEKTLDSLVSSGVFVYAFFILTDSVTNPLTRAGRFVFGAAAALLVLTLRTWTNDFLAMTAAGLAVNGLTPLMDRYLYSKRLTAQQLPRIGRRRFKEETVA